MLITRIDPSQGSVNVPLQHVIEIEFDLSIDPNSVDQASVTVGTKKTTLVSLDRPKFNFTQSYATDDFFNDEFSGIVPGTIRIKPGNDKVLQFTPKLRYQPNTEYTVYIGQAILPVTGSGLSKIYTFTFKTAEEDIVEQIPFVESKIYVSDITDIEPETTSEIISVYPNQGAFLVKPDTIVSIRFNKEVNTLTYKSFIEIYQAEVFSDYPEELIDSADYSVSLSESNKKITITFLELLPANSVVFVKLLTGFPFTVGTLTSDFTLTFSTRFSSYYSTTKLVRLKCGTLVSNISDINIASTIYYISEEANMKLKKISNMSDYAYLREKWVLYNTIGSLLHNNMNGMPTDFIKKQLGDFNISISNGAKVKIYNSMIDEVARFNRTFDNFINFATDTESLSRGKYARNTRSRGWFRGEQPALNDRDPVTDRMLFDDYNLFKGVCV